MSEYDTAGRLSAQLDPFGERTEYVYDDANRQISVTDPKDNTSTTVYGPQGRTESTITPSGTTTYGYDFQSYRCQTELYLSRVRQTESYDSDNRERKGTQLID